MLEDLRDRVAARRVVVFVGTGVSSGASKSPLAGWKAFLDEGVARCDTMFGSSLPPGWAQRQRDALGRGDLDEWLNVAEAISRKLDAPRGGEFRRWLRETVGQLEVRRREVIEAIDALRAPLVTTNYDDLLENVTGRSAISWRHEHHVSRFIEDGLLRDVLHVHGHWDDSESIVLGVRSYDRIVGHEHAQSMLRTLLMTYTAVFIGYGEGLGDPNFGTLRTWAASVLRGVEHRHYRLCLASEEPKLREDHQGERIFPLVYGDSHDQLERFLRSLVPSPGVAQPSPSQPAEAGPGSSPAHSGPSSLGNRVHSVPYRAKRDRVIGRAGVLERVHQQLTSGRPTAIGHTASFQGIGGLGKTQLAVEYADRYGETYAGGVIWLDADRDIDAQLLKISDEARWVDPRSEHQLKLDVALHRLRTHTGCLIVFDNVNDPAAIQRYLPVPAAAAHILVTSRAEQPGFDPIELDVLDTAQSLELLVQEAGRAPANDDERAAAQAIAARLAGLPLALEIAGAYIRHRAPILWRDYQRLLDDSFKQALAGSFLQSLTSHDKDLYATLRVSEAMLGDEPQLRDVLDVLTVSGSASMGTSLLAALLDVSETALIGPLSLAVKLRLLGTEDDPTVGGGQRYRIHRLVQEVRRDEIAIEQRTAWAQDVSRRLAAWFEQRRVDRTDLLAFEAEIDHLRAWQQHALDGHWPVRARLAWLQGYPHFHRGRYREAHEWVEAAERYHRETPAGDDLDALLADDMGQLEHKLGNPRNALGYYQRALELRRQRHGDGHADMALSLRNVARSYRELGDYKKALELGEQALDMSLAVHGPRHRTIASVLNGVGLTYVDLGDHRKALDFLSRALQLNEELLGAGHPDLATFLGNVGTTYGGLGDDQTALTLQRQAFEIEQKAFGDEHPTTATSRCNLALTYLRLGEHRLAMEHAERALKTRREMLGDDHPDTGLSLNNVAVVHDALGDHAKALTLSEQALRVYTRMFGETHPKTAAALNNIGMLYNELGDRETALVLTQRSLDVRRSVLGEDHPDTADSFANVSAIETRLGHHKHALEHARGALDILVKVHGPGHSRTLDIMLVVVDKWLHYNRLDAAYHLLESWLDKLPLDHPRRAALTARLRKLPPPRGRRKAPATSKRPKKQS